MKLYLSKKKSKEYGISFNSIDYHDYQKIIEISGIINSKRNSLVNPEIAITPSELYIYSIFPKIYEIVIKRFEQSEYISIKNLFLVSLSTYEKNEIENFLKNFEETYGIDITENTNSLFIIKLLNENPAFRKIDDLLSDKELKEKTFYSKIFKKIEDELSEYKSKKFNNKSLLEFLREPFINESESIYKQLLFIIKNWKDVLGDEIDFLLKAIDYYKEDRKFGLPGPGPSHIYSFLEEEPEQFSEDKDWMPHLVLIAKSTFVWLYQLSKKYKREIKHLDQIPEEEFKLLHDRGFSGLWLIGIWQRSKISQKIKQLTGQIDAIASAYSLDDYQIAVELGGEEAYIKLKEKAWKYHIRLACDMVPNHTGMDSDWIVNHPEYFMQLDYPPFPSYTFNGVNLSEKSEIKVFLEDHYYDKSDAAVVFKLIDKNNITRYIYHGNDGTSFPWNDTAQLDYTKEFVRKAVIQKIIEVARRFPIIRFDAAMTLAKKHFQRLWFPQPGSGGAIPSRAQFGLTKEEFDKLFPKEFWREVVDRVATEAPDTLLLAEAFWMMEGYFVRTLGMHRVYNSAFMNMLKDEENAKYRKSIFNILEFNPQILKRFVNFMSNPDEETAIKQFGDNDKYFGVCILMSTMPGLPMFAHGQIEGYHERYGMEYYKPRWEEAENISLIERHNREIFPLLKMRRYFSDVENFYLYDFNVADNEINENVFVYSNEHRNEISLVIYHNKYEEIEGSVRFANYPKKKGDEIIWQKINIAENLKLHNDENYFVIYKDFISQKEFIRNSKEIWDYGLHYHLKAYQYHVFINFREIKDNEKEDYKAIAKYLQGGGTNDIEHLKNKIKYLFIINSFVSYLNEKTIKQILKFTDISTGEYAFYLTEYLKPALLNLDIKIIKHKNIEKVISDLKKFITEFKNVEFIFENKKQSIGETVTVFLMINRLETENFEKYYLWEEVEQTINRLTLQKDNINLIKALLKLENATIKDENDLVNFLFEDTDMKTYLLLNLFDNHYWFNKERFEFGMDVLKTVYSIKNQEIDFNKIKKIYKLSEFKADKMLKLMRK